VSLKEPDGGARPFCQMDRLSVLSGGITGPRKGIRRTWEPRRRKKSGEYATGEREAKFSFMFGRIRFLVLGGGAALSRGIKRGNIGTRRASYDYLYGQPQGESCPSPWAARKHQELSTDGLGRKELGGHGSPAAGRKAGGVRHRRARRVPAPRFPFVSIPSGTGRLQSRRAGEPQWFGKATLKTLANCLCDGALINGFPPRLSDRQFRPVTECAFVLAPNRKRFGRRSGNWR
jgi:hypothetical protein